MTGADKVVCHAATLLLLFTLTSMPAKAQFAGFGGGGGGEDMMTQMAPMLEMMKAKMGKRRFAMMMQTMGPMMSGMMEGGGGGGLGGMMGGGGIPGWLSAAGIPAGMGWRLRRRLHGHDGRHWRRRADGHGPATDADGECGRRPSGTAVQAAVRLDRVIPRCCASTRTAMRNRSIEECREPRRCAIAHRGSILRTRPRNDGSPFTTAPAALQARRVASVPSGSRSR